jgi:superoxide reductase
MNRRSFLRLSAAGAATGLIVPSFVHADAVQEALAGPLAGKVYYTKESPGRWAKKAGSHVPVLEVQSGGDEVSIQVVTSHGMHGYEHYIVKHILLSQDFGFVAEHMFDPEKDEAPISQFVLPSGYRGPVYAVSMCNKHDTWLNGIEV